MATLRTYQAADNDGGMMVEMTTPLSNSQPVDFTAANGESQEEAPQAPRPGNYCATDSADSDITADIILHC